MRFFRVDGGRDAPTTGTDRRGRLALAAAGRAEAADADVLKMLDDFAAAWNRHDVDGLMACMTADCVFEAAAGKEVAGTRHVGAAAVRRAYAAVFETYADARWNNPRHFVAGDRAVSEWTFTGTTKDGHEGGGQRLRRLHARGRQDRASRTPIASSAAPRRRPGPTTDAPRVRPFGTRGAWQ